MTDLVERSAAALAADIASGALSAEELMRASLDRIAQTNGVVNAIVALRDEEALMHDARASDASTATGPLKGLPVAIKDLVNAEGLPTTLGCTIFKNNIAAKDDVMVARMKAAGAIVIGKTNTPEFGLGSHTFNPVYGATRNPYAPARSAGGSSGGAAAALAAGMIPIADGSVEQCLRVAAHLRAGAARHAGRCVPASAGGGRSHGAHARGRGVIAGCASGPEPARSARL